MIVAIDGRHRDPDVVEADRAARQQARADALADKADRDAAAADAAHQRARELATGSPSANGSSWAPLRNRRYGSHSFSHMTRCRREGVLAAAPGTWNPPQLGRLRHLRTVQRHDFE